MVHIEDIEKPHHNNNRRPSVAEACPYVAGQWYYKLNCGWGPGEFSTGSNVQPWWQCDRDKKHIWRAQIYKRCTKGHDCPLCFGKNRCARPVIEERSFAYCHPELLDEWHPTLNGSLTPETVLAGANTIIWWRCRKKKRHVWDATLKSRSHGRGCPKCYDDRMLDLRDFPEILKLFDKKKNKFLDPYKLTTTTVVWWRCPEGPDHSWQSRFNKKSLLCKCCRNKQVSVTNSLETLYPKVAKQLHPTRNGNLTADKICAYTSKIVWWRCPMYPHHVWEAAVNNRTRNESRCPDCYKARKKSGKADKAKARDRKRPINSETAEISRF
jgi:hypothetical protein